MVNENNIPKIETVYELKENTYEIKTSKLSPAARSKIIKKYGTDYLSKKAFTHDIALMEMYGPGFLDLFLAPAVIGKKTLENPTARFGAKVMLTTTAGVVLGPAAIPVGAAVWGGSEIIRNNTDDEETKKALGFISDCGQDTFTGGLWGVAAQGAGAVAGFNKFAGLGKNCGNCIASAKHGIKVAGTIEFWISKGFEAKDATMHIAHKCDGVEYKVGCKVCEA